ncbi:cytochrome d ubiquinol oxidase subunit II [Umezawaea tangerina]|uniref:Cytochrome bd-I ubiquinol oxidase subunit 2 apoprotein n=1 Tax=Umezawaea tangerina TaxID=84725 RepID=A0A2T0TM46_9PSEU|nr:cytochrome d ubiquinol oxidase subunit II [Umezawaea tangerina]PRY46794.1 cytochrome bd-I ubiquinol oxidase subunit 2 apoprotein [Umezawaea tangerina]
MESFWIVLLGLLAAGYFALAGFDYGTALLFRFVGRDERERGRALGAMTPFVLGDEVWLVAAVGVLFGAFPRLEGELLSGHHGAFVTIVTGLVAFTAAVQLRGAAPVWDVPLVGGALAVAVGWGVLAADVTGAPAPLWIVGVVGLFSLHGGTFLAWRLPGRAGVRARALARSLVLPCLLFVPAAVLLAGPVARPEVGVGVAVAVVVLLLGAWVTSGRVAFCCTAIACALPVPAVFAAQDVVTAETMAGTGTLAVLVPAAVVVLPLVLLFQWATWWMVRVRHA